MTNATLQIKTPEGILFSQPLAGPMPRFLAWLLDCVAWIAVATAINTLLGLLAWISPELSQAFMILLLFACGLGYGMFFEWFWRGQTPGKRALRLRVVDAEGLRLQPSQVVLRNLLRVVDTLPLAYGVGGLAVLMNTKYQRLGDLAAGTVVVRVPKLVEPDIDQLVAGKFNSMRAYPHLVARLRQRVTPQEASLAAQSLMRRGELDPQCRVLLFSEVAAHFRSLVNFPEEATTGLADEQYLRNIVDLLYRTEASKAPAVKASNPVAEPVSTNTDSPSPSS